MQDQKVLEKEKAKLDKLVKTRRDQEDALRLRINHEEENRSSAEADMLKAASADNMVEFQSAKNRRDTAKDMIDFCKERLAAIDTSYDAEACRTAVNSVCDEYEKIRRNIYGKLAGLAEECSSLCGDLIEAKDRKTEFRNWVERDLLRLSDLPIRAPELNEIYQLKVYLDTRLKFLIS